jgi:type I restriction enzyme S subunit
VLLSSIETQMAATTKKAGSRKKRALEPIDLSEAPFQLPAGWAWGRFPELGTFGRGKSKHRPRNDARLFEKGSHPLIQTGDVARSNGVIETITNYYNDFGLAQSLKWPKGTLCITIAANIADSGILNFAACFPDSVVGFIPAPVFKSARYFEYFVRTAKANLLEFAPATAQKNINLEILSSVLIPLPPLAEQERIVAKVDELLALCDQLEASLATGETTRSRLLDALLHEALTPAPMVHVEHPRAAVSGYVVSRLASKRNFGRTAHMKHLYLAESRLGLKLGGRYERQAAGPLDAGIYELEKQAEAAGWYTYNVEKLPSGKEKVSYVPGKALKALAEEGAAVLGSSRKEMDRLIDLMGGLKTEQVEIIATLFAAWNDALLDGHTPGDNWIVKEVREHWHASKQRFAPDDLRTWLGWMRQNDVVPLGHPPRTMQQTTMEF